MIFKCAMYLCLLVITSADVYSHTRKSITYTDPEYRTDFKNVHAIEELPGDSYEYQIVPTSDYEITEYKSSETSLTDFILSPVRALAYVGSTAATAIGWVLTKLSLIIFGMAIVIGFCAFTTHCTLTVENPFSREFRSSIPYLNEIEYYFMEAYKKYHVMQSSLLS